MRNIFVLAAACVALTFSKVVLASDEHGQDHNKEHAPEEQHDDHEQEAPVQSENGEDHGEGHGDEHGHEEENTQVGPEKGLLAVSAEEGIKLSPEAEKNFAVQKVKVPPTGQIEITKAALVTAGVEVNLYRYRGGFYKRIDFDLLSRTGSKILVRAKELKAGDEVAITGLGFLRIAEIAAFGGAPEGHSH